MKFLVIATLTLLAGLRPDTGLENNYQKPRLPLIVQFMNTPHPVQLIVRQQLADKGIDTISTMESINLLAAELRERLETARRNNSSFNATSAQPKFFMTWFGVEMNEIHHINRICWKAFAMPSTYHDTSRKYYLVPDSLQTDAAKAISGCIDAMIKARAFR